jgi:drug/metabolite transporter (DMT)-like permease
MSSKRGLIVALSMIVTILLWGSAFAGIRMGLRSFSPTHLALLRYLCASLAMAVFAVATRMPMPVLRELPAVFLLGFLGFAFYNVALNIGERSIASGPAALLIQTSPIWTALLASVFLRERLNAFGWLGIGIGFCGALVISLGKGMSFAPNLGAALILCASVSASIYTIIQKRMLSRYRPVQLTAYAVWAGTLLLLPFAGGFPAALASAASTDMLAVVFLGVGPAAAGYALWAFVISGMPASRAVSFLYAIPVVAFIVGWLLLGEVPGPQDIVGGLVALAGVAMVNTLGRESPPPPGAGKPADG